MISFVTYLEPERWRIKVYILEHCGEGADIIDELAHEGCIGTDLADASHEIRRCGMNIGITFSVGEMRNSILVIGLQSSRSEFVNTLRHEQHHVISHICKQDGIDMHSEESAYVAGDVGEAIYDRAHKLRLV